MEGRTSLGAARRPQCGVWWEDEFDEVWGWSTGRGLRDRVSAGGQGMGCVPLPQPGKEFGV